MAYLIVGLLIFLGVHSLRIVADDWRTARIAGSGENAWKSMYSLASAAGLGLIVWGYGLARAEPLALSYKGGEEKSPYECNFITRHQNLLDAHPTPPKRLHNEIYKPFLRRIHVHFTCH